MKDHHIASLDGLKAVDELVDEEPVLILQPRQHAGALHAHRLVKKGDDKDRGGSGKQQIAQQQPNAPGSMGRRGNWCERRLLQVRFRRSGLIGTREVGELRFHRFL